MWTESDRWMSVGLMKEKWTESWTRQSDRREKLILMEQSQPVSGERCCSWFVGSV